MSNNIAERVTISVGSGWTASAVRQLRVVGFNWIQALRWRLSLYRSRRDLQDLSDDQLRDIGVTREAAAAEARRGFDWR